MSAADEALLVGALGWQSVERLTLQDVSRSQVTTLLSAGTVPAVPFPEHAVRDAEPSIRVAKVRRWVHQGQASRPLAESTNRFGNELQLLSSHTVISVTGDVLARVWTAAGNDQGPAGLALWQWLRTLLHASGLRLTELDESWVIPARTVETGTFMAQLHGLDQPKLIPALVTVVLADAPGEAHDAEKTLESVRRSDMASCALIVSRGPHSPVSLGPTLFTLLIHPGQQMHSHTGQILLRLLGEQPVALLRALVDGPSSPVELWCTRALKSGLAQDLIEVDSFAREYGDERWIAASWAGIGLDGSEPSRIPKRLIERIG